MSKLKAELSSKNDYFIPKHRYYELKHFCLQYNDWKKSYESVSYISSPSFDKHLNPTFIGDPVSKAVAARLFFKSRMEMVEDAAYETDPLLFRYILKAVTEGVSYDVLRARENIPCCRESWYAAYRRFFWILSRARN